MAPWIGWAIGTGIYIAAVGLVEFLFRRRVRRLARQDVAREVAQMIKDDTKP